MRTRYGPSLAQVVGETRATGHGAGSYLRPLRFLAALLLAAVFVQACGIGGGGGSDLAGILALVPADSEDITVYDFELIRREEAPRALRDEVEFYVSEYGLEEMGVLTDELTTLAVAFGDDWYLLVVEGDIDSVHITDRLDDGDFDNNQYRGFELWEGGAWPYESVALFEDRGRMVIGDTEAVKRVLRMLDRGSGSLLDDADSDLGRVLKRAGEGWISGAQEQCPGYEVRGCRALGVSLRRGDDDSLVEITVAVLFRNERTAESEMDELESQIEEDSSFEFDIDGVRLDGDFVIVTGSGDKDDLFEGEDDVLEGESAVPVTPAAAEVGDAPDTRAPATRDDHGDLAREATFVTVGDAVAGVLDHGRDVDYFAFAAERGETYRIDVDLGTLEDSVATLYDSRSRLLEFDDDGGQSFGSRITWTAAESGTYYIAVEGWGSDTGSYALTVTAVGDAPDTRAPDTRDDHGDSTDEATFVTVGDPVAGVVNHGSDLDYFAFAAERGQTYEIDLKLGTLDDSVAALFDSDSQELAFDDDGGESLGSRITWTAAESRTHYVGVAGWGSETGSYTLTVTATKSEQAVGEPEASDATGGAGGGPPDSPANQRYEYDGSSIVLTWDAASGADSYTVYYDDFFDSACSVRSGGPSFCDELATNLSSTSYTHTAPAPDEHYYWVVACNRFGCSEVESANPAQLGGSPPGVPANQRYEYDGSSIVLTWDAASGADSYTVYYDDFFDSACSVRSGGPSFCEELATDLTGTTYRHADPDARENYYWVVACNNYGCSAVESDNPARAAP